MFCIFWSLSGTKRELKCVRLLDRWGFSQDGTCLWFPVIWYARSIQWSKCKPPKWECDDDYIAEWLDVAANMSDRVFTPSASFIFPSYLHTLPSFILTVKSLNLWYPIPFILTASLSLSFSPSVLWRASLIKMASAFHLFSKSDLNLYTHSEPCWHIFIILYQASLDITVLTVRRWIAAVKTQYFEKCEYISEALFIYRSTLSACCSCTAGVLAVVLHLF